VGKLAFRVLVHWPRVLGRPPTWISPAGLSSLRESRRSFEHPRRYYCTTGKLLRSDKENAGLPPEQNKQRQLGVGDRSELLSLVRVVCNSHFPRLSGFVGSLLLLLLCLRAITASKSKKQEQE